MINVPKTFQTLLNVIFEESKHLRCLASMRYDTNLDKVTIRNALALHYFQPLVYDSECFVGKGGLNTCKYCSQEVKVGDTLLGNWKVWHGRTDIILKNCIIKVETEPNDDEDEGEKFARVESASKKRKLEEDSRELSSIAEVNLDKTYFNNTWSGALADGIVNAFCEANKNKSLSNEFVPSFYVTEKDIRIIMYNCELDILHVSDEMEIWGELGDMLNINTLVLVWLALNIDNIDMEFPPIILEITPHSEFKNVIEDDAYSIYLQNMSKPLEQKPEKIQPETVTPFRKSDNFFCIGETICDQLYTELLDLVNKEEDVTNK